MTGKLPRPASHPPRVTTDGDVIAWTVRHCREQLGEAFTAFTLATGEDLERLVVTAADQVRAHSSTRGTTDHIITRTALWPVEGDDAVILTVALQAETDRVRLTEPPLPVRELAADGIVGALVRVIVHARCLIARHRRWAAPPCGHT